MSRILGTVITGCHNYHAVDASMYDTPMNRPPRPFYVPQVSRAFWDEYTLGWPRSGLSGGDAPLQTCFTPGAYDPYLQSTLFVGGGGYYKFTGVTRDSSGAALGSCVVQLFHTSDDAFVQQSTSEASGDYYLESNQADAHYIVAYKPGSPDVAGTTVNTLTGAL